MRISFPAKDEGSKINHEESDTSGSGRPKTFFFSISYLFNRCIGKSEDSEGFKSCQY